MIIRVQVTLPADGIWDLNLPEIPPESEGKQQFLEEWVWKHGKDQLLSKLVFSSAPTNTSNDDDDDKNNPHSQEEKEEEKVDKSIQEEKDQIDDSTSNSNKNSIRSYQRTSAISSSPQRKTQIRFNHRRRSTGDNSCSECSPARTNNNAADAETLQQQKQRLDLVDKLQTVQQDFLERVQHYDCLEDLEEDDDPEGDNPLSFPNNPAHIALRELLDSVLEWSGTDYGFVAGVEQHKVVPPPTQNMNDVSELDHSDMGDHLYDQKVWKVGPKVAAVNVPYSNQSEDKEWFSDSSLGEFDDDSSVDEKPANSSPLQRQPQPITTYGPVHYKNIPGSLTLMMDQLRFEPVNPLDMVHEGDDEDNSEQSGSASHEYNYMEVYWDKVEKYQLTPTTSSRNHLFKLIVRKDSKYSTTDDTTKRTTEVVLKMRSRAELERIAEDVKTRVVLPSRRKTKKPKDPPRRRRRRRRRRDDKSKAIHNSESPSSVAMTPRERSVMMPPSLPQRMTSDRNLLVSSSGHSQEPPLFLVNQNNSHNSPAPRPPVRKLTSDDLMRDLSFVDDDSDYYDDSESESDDDDDGHEELYSIQDLLEKCRHLKRPLTYKARKRDKKPADDPIQKEEEALALLPKQWQRLVVLPIFESKESERMQSILVLSLTGKITAPLQQTSSIDFASRKGLDGWIPAVTTMVQDLWQHKLRLEQLSRASKTVFGLRGQLKESLRRHSDMIHGILPPMAVAKLKVQPQQWKSPLLHQGYYHSHMNTSKPSAIVPLTGAASVDDSSISGSIHSRYSLLFGASSLDSNSTLQTLVPGGPHSTDGLPRVAENLPTNKLPERSASTKTAQQKGSRTVPQRTNSVGNVNAAIRGLQQHPSGGSMPGKTAIRPVFNRMDSKRSMMMQAMRQATGSARGAGLMRMDSAKRGNLIKMDSARFRGIPRLNSLRSLHTTGLSVATSGASVDTSLFEQSWRTMYTDAEEQSLHPEDFSQHSRSTQRLGALSQDVSYLTNETSVRYINSSFVGGMKDVQALYAGKKTNVSIVVISVVHFQELKQKLKVATLMDLLAKLQFTVDRLCEKHRTIKVESIGNTIVVMSGLFVSDSEDENADKRNNNSEEQAKQDKRAAIAALEMAKEVVSEAQTIEIPKGSGDNENAASSKKSPAETMKVRVGIHVGDVKYGVLGQNVPQLNCFGENNDMLVAMRMEQTAPDDCIRVSRCFRDLVGDSEREWEKDSEMVEICCYNNLSDVIASNSESTAPTNSDASPFSMETFSLEPPPPAISGANCASVTSFSSLAPFGSSDFLQVSDHGGMLGVQLEESMVSGEFDVD